MAPPPSPILEHARTIWQAAVDAVRPEALVREAFEDASLGLGREVSRASRIVVVGAGKAGAAMSAGVEEQLAGALDRVTGLVNIPAGTERALRKVRLHVARPAATNEPTPDGVAGARHILDLVVGAGAGDLCICLISGGGSALLPAPAEGVSLEDKQQVTRLLHASGATINEMNAVRKHLSRVKGGQLARAFSGRLLFSLIISDVVGDPLDVIASGPTVPDPTTFADALAVLERYQLMARAPAAVRAYLERGASGDAPETPKALGANVRNVVIGNNARALAAAAAAAGRLGYRVVNLGSLVEGETRAVATAFAGIARSVGEQGLPVAPPACLLSGGETTVTLPAEHGLGGRNQEFVLAAAVKLGPDRLGNVVVLSGGTDGEDGPTDAAGAWADAETLRRADRLGLSPAAFLARHDAYHFFKAIGALCRTGPTNTNVMDVRIILVARP